MNSMKISHKITNSLLFFIISILPFSLSAKQAERKQFQLTHNQQVIKVDGIMDEAVWKTATKMELNYEKNPGDGTPPWSPRVWSLATTVGQFQVLSRTRCQAHDFCDSRSGLVHFCQSEASVWRLFVFWHGGRVVTRCQGHLSGVRLLQRQVGPGPLFPGERSGFEDGSSSRVEAWCHKVTLWYPQLHKLLVVMASPLAFYFFWCVCTVAALLSTRSLWCLASSLEATRLGGDSFVCLIAEGAAGVLPLSSRLVGRDTT